MVFESNGYGVRVTVLVSESNHTNANTKKGQAYGFKLEVIDVVLQ
jgi:hypothetical protein